MPECGADGRVRVGWVPRDRTAARERIQRPVGMTNSRFEFPAHQVRPGRLILRNAAVSHILAAARPAPP
jgi:hypothetical protein